MPARPMSSIISIQSKRTFSLQPPGGGSANSKNGWTKSQRASIRDSGKCKPVTNNQFGTDWFTPLTSAAGNNRTEVVRWLLSQGADPTANDGNERSVLSVAKEHAGPDVVKLIEDALN